MSLPEVQLGSVVAGLVVQLTLVLMLSLAADLDCLLDIGELGFQLVAMILVGLALRLEVVDGLLHLVLFLGLSLNRVLMSESLVGNVLQLAFPCAL